MKPKIEITHEKKNPCALDLPKNNAVEELGVHIANSLYSMLNRPIGLELFLKAYAEATFKKRLMKDAFDIVENQRGIE